MKNKMRNLLVSIIVALTATVWAPCQMITAFAATARIAFSDPTAVAGAEITVKMKVTTADGTLGSSDIMLAYDSSMLEFVSGTNASGGAGSIRVSSRTDTSDTKQLAYTLTFKALQAGNTKITVNTQEIYDTDSRTVTVDKQGSSAVTIAAPANASNNSSLASLQISPGIISPDFSAGIGEYTAEVDGNTDKIIVSAPAADAGAKVVISGTDNLVTGENTILCQVTAADGVTVSNYTIKITKAEGTGEDPTQTSELNVTVNDQKYTVASMFDETTLPEGFEAAAYTYHGTEIQAGKGIEKNLLLIALTDSQGQSKFFIYDEGTDSWTPYAQIETTAKAIVIVPLDADAVIPVGLTETSIEIEGNTVSGWIWESADTKEYCIVYGMNWDGEKNFYRYDLSEKTIQRYFQDPNVDTGVSTEVYEKVAVEHNNLINDYNTMKMILIGMIAAVALLLIILIVVLATGKKKSGSGRKDSYRDDDEEDVPSVISSEERYMLGIEPEDIEHNQIKEDNVKPDKPEDKDDDDFEIMDIHS